MKGAKDADFPQKRAVLIARMRERLSLADADHPSFRQLAAFAGVSQATLRHYFGTLTDVIVSVLETYAVEGEPYLAQLSRPSGAFEESVAAAVEFLAMGQRQAAVRAMHAIGNAEGVRRKDAGAVYRTAILDPVFRAMTTRLDAHVRSGEMRPCDTLAAAIALCAPLFLVFQHQDDLRGRLAEPIDLNAFIISHVEGFIRGYRC